MSISHTKILDKGYVSLEAVMGDDWTPVEAARVSTDKGSKGEDSDTRLTRFLLDNGHSSPFEMIEMRWEVVCPIFVAREWVRHRTANWNERSLRYTEVDNPEFYIPDIWRLQDEKNKQSSFGVLTGKEADDTTKRLIEWTDQGLEHYKHLKSIGVANEMARFFLPVTYYTKFWWKNDMKNTMHFLSLREEAGAQQEIREYAEAMHKMLSRQFPKLMRIYDSIT